ncbi:MAG: hypothetical protein J0I41_12840 [Filimonas sp.]|nr:hypothetical protein [Filimonas sp.]
MKTLVLALCCVLTLASCQKEFSINDPNNNGNNGGSNNGNEPPKGGSDGTLLLKIYQVNTKNDTIATSFSYDTNDRVIGYTLKGKDDTTKYDMALKFTRDADGKITQLEKSMKLKDLPGADAFTAFGLSPDDPVKIEMDVHYPAGSKEFDYTVETTDLKNATLVTKKQYTYTNGKITNVAAYQTVSMFGTVLQKEQLTMQYEYIYATNGNISSFRISMLDPSAPQSTSLKLTEIVNYTYNDKKSSIPFSNEYFLWQQDGSNSNNFLTEMSINDDKNKPFVVMEFKNAIFNSHDLVQACNMVITSDVDPPTPPTSEQYKRTFYYK